jgi:hypothetical protein
VWGYVFVALAAIGCGRSGFDTDASPMPDVAVDAPPAPLPTNIAFVTSTVQLPTTFAADLSGADAICAARATAGGLPANKYVAFLATTANNAFTRLAGARGW